MTISNEQRDSALAAASEETRVKYSSPETGKFLWQVAESHSLTKSETYTTFALIVGDVILGLRKTFELPEVFAKELSLANASAVKLTSDLIEFLGGEMPEDLAGDIAETEAALQAIPKVRTMADDVHKAQSDEPTYSTSQAAILGEAKTPIPPAQ